MKMALGPFSGPYSRRKTDAGITWVGRMAPVLMEG